MIVATLNNYSILRLHRTWRIVDTSFKDLLEEMNQLMFRPIYDSSRPESKPVLIPFLGYYFTRKSDLLKLMSWSWWQISDVGHRVTINRILATEPTKLGPHIPSPTSVTNIDVAIVKIIAKTEWNPWNSKIWESWIFNMPKTVQDFIRNKSLSTKIQGTCSETKSVPKF